MSNAKTKTSCRNCFGMGQTEQGSNGPIDCRLCRGKGYIETIKRVDHFDPVRINTKKLKAK